MREREQRPPRRSFVLRLAFLALVPAATGHAETPTVGWSDTVYATGLSAPTALAFLPDGRLLVTQKGGSGGGLVSAAGLTPWVRAGVLSRAGLYARTVAF